MLSRELCKERPDVYFLWIELSNIQINMHNIFFSNGYFSFMEKELSRRYLFLSLSFIHKLKTKKNNRKRPFLHLQEVNCWTCMQHFLLIEGAKGLPCDFLLLAERTLVEILSEDDGRTTSCFIMMFSTSSGNQRFPNNVTEYFKQFITRKKSILSKKISKKDAPNVLGTDL